MNDNEESTQEVTQHRISDEELRRRAERFAKYVKHHPIDYPHPFPGAMSWKVFQKYLKKDERAKKRAALLANMRFARVTSKCRGTVPLYQFPSSLHLAILNRYYGDMAG